MSREIEVFVEEFRKLIAMRVDHEESLGVANIGEVVNAFTSVTSLSLLDLPLAILSIR